MKKTLRALHEFFLLIQDDERKETRLRRILPILGSSEGFVSALQKYFQAKLVQDQIAQGIAREKGLTALLDLMSDSALLVSFLGPYRFLKTIFVMPYLSRTSKLLGIPELDLSGPLARQLLKSQKVERLVDELFERVRKLFVTAVEMDSPQ